MTLVAFRPLGPWTSFELVCIQGPKGKPMTQVHYYEMGSPNATTTLRSDLIKTETFDTLIRTIVLKPIDFFKLNRPESEYCAKH